MAIARKGRHGRLELEHPTLGWILVAVRQKGKSDETPEVNITTTESPNGEPEYDDEGGTPNRELTFTTVWYKNKPQVWREGNAYNFRNYVGSKELLDRETGRLFIRQITTEGEESEGDSVVTLSHTCRVGNYVAAPRPLENPNPS